MSNVAQTEPALSVLDLVPVSAGRSRRDALREMIALARAADAAGAVIDRKSVV